MAMSVAPVRAAKCWIRERVAGRAAGVVAVEESSRRRSARDALVGDGRGNEMSCVFSELSEQREIQHGQEGGSLASCL